MVSLFGLADSSWITYEKFAGVTPSCYLTTIFDCGQVLGSRWANIGPFPLSFFGMGFYLAVFLIAVGLLVHPKPYVWLRPALLTLATFGFAFSLYLTAIQAFLIQAFCFFCVLSAISSTTIFAFSGVGWFHSRKMKEPNAITGL